MKGLCSNLAEFIAPWLVRFSASCICLGGNVTKYKENFIIAELKHILNVDVKQSILYEDAAILGGVAAFLSASVTNSNHENNTSPSFRLTKQALLPISKPKSSFKNTYDIFPTFKCSQINAGYESLVNEILDSNRNKILLDGFVGIRFDCLRQTLDEWFKLKNKKVLWREMSSALKSQTEIDTLLAPCDIDNNDPLFGKRCLLQLK